MRYKDTVLRPFSGIEGMVNDEADDLLERVAVVLDDRLVSPSNDLLSGALAKGISWARGIGLSGSCISHELVEEERDLAVSGVDGPISRTERGGRAKEAADPGKIIGVVPGDLEVEKGKLDVVVHGE